jgi:esterase/lipase
MKLRQYCLLLLSLAALVLAGCAPKHPDEMPLGQSSFAQYAAETSDWMARNRHFVTDNHAEELSFHTPFEVRPEGKIRGAVLLVHGLGDSPWTFKDIAKRLAAEGYLVRTVILPGHGTKPADMIGVSDASWQRAVDEQMALLKKESANVWIGGFSTGGNLAVKYALTHPEVSGMILYSPALALKFGLIKLAPVVDLFITWLRSPDEKTLGVEPFKYKTTPMDAIVSFKHTMDDSYEMLSKAKYDKPVIAMMSEHDSILDTPELLRLFDSQFTHPATRILWYGTLPEGAKVSDRVEVRPDYIPEKRIASFAHMSIPFAPDNVWYGENGKYRFCRKSEDNEAYAKCLNLTSDEVWYGAWGTKGANRVYARLTYNPYFDEQTKETLKVMEAGSAK